MTESRFLHHEPCPQCRSRDNLGVWDDGHKYCFGCHYMELPDGKSQMMNYVNKKKPINNEKAVLPDDFEFVLPKFAREWCYKYGITDDDIKEHQFGYCINRDLLIYPVYDPFDNLVMWQGRYFGNNGEYPKYLTAGKPAEILHILDEKAEGNSYSRNFVVITEDVVSAIRVGRHFPAMPVWGSSISLKQATRLSKTFAGMVIWLDNDKALEARKMAQEFKLLFDWVEVRSTKADPKDQGHHEIPRIIFDVDAKHPFSDYLEEAAHL